MMIKSYLKELNPITQGIISILIISLIAIICLIFGIKSTAVWSLMFTPLLLFCVINPVIGVFYKKKISYSLLSILILIVISYYAYFIGNTISDFSYKQTQELHFIAALVFIFYFMFISISLIFRGVLHLLQEIDK